MVQRLAHSHLEENFTHFDRLSLRGFIRDLLGLKAYILLE